VSTVRSPGGVRWLGAVRWLGGVRWAGVLRWYLRELTGEAGYDRYLARHPALHPGEPVMTRREFEVWRWTEKANTPGNRCC
jgi:uncharacterized short protein YbdD (DUF466 family)